jgi:hypothetical protein
MAPSGGAVESSPKTSCFEGPSHFGASSSLCLDFGTARVIALGHSNPTSHAPSQVAYSHCLYLQFNQVCYNLLNPLGTSLFVAISTPNKRPQNRHRRHPPPQLAVAHKLQFPPPPFITHRSPPGRSTIPTLLLSYGNSGMLSIARRHAAKRCGLNTQARTSAAAARRSSRPCPSCVSLDDRVTSAGQARQASSAPWRPVSVLDEYVKRLPLDMRPILSREKAGACVTNQSSSND